jgi:integrase
LKGRGFSRVVIGDKENATLVAEEYFRANIKLAPGTKAKVRNHMSCLFSHCIRHELYTRPNPVSSVRQSAKRLREPDILTVDELKAIISRVDPPAIRVMVMVAGSSALRRSEIRGLKWSDVDLEGLWFHLKRGVVRKHLTHMKTEASRKGLPMLPELAEALAHWRTETPYPRDADWVFASPYTNGERPYWAESAMQDHIRPAARAAGIHKHIAWHTFRHSLGTIWKTNREDVKTIRELLRHANSRISLDVYTQRDIQAKRSALSQVSGIFVVPRRSA